MVPLEYGSTPTAGRLSFCPFLVTRTHLTKGSRQSASCLAAQSDSLCDSVVCVGGGCGQTVIANNHTAPSLSLLSIRIVTVTCHPLRHTRVYEADRLASRASRSSGAAHLWGSLPAASRPSAAGSRGSSDASRRRSQDSRTRDSKTRGRSGREGTASVGGVAEERRGG